MKIGGRYEYDENHNQLGKGGFGTTFLAKDTKRPGNPLCVVKKFTPPSTEPDTSLKKLKEFFDQEAEILEKLGKHDQIPTLLAHFAENQEFFIVQEYIEGHDLSDELTSCPKMSESDVIKLLLEILEVLEFVHKNEVIHRDITPRNIRRRQSDNKIVLIDFGAVKQISTQLVNNQGQITSTLIIGTTEYMPPERKIGRTTFSSDIYSVGIIALQALTGLRPEESEDNNIENNNILKDNNTLKIVWRDHVNVSPKLAEILDKMVNSDPIKRYHAAKEALEALRCLSFSNDTVNQNQTLESNDKGIVRTVVVALNKNSNSLIQVLLVVIPLIIFTIIATSTIIFIPKMITQRENFLPYENKKYGIKIIKYPESWSPPDIENPVTGEFVTFLSPKQKNGDQFQERLTISVEEKFYGTLEEFTNSNKKEIKNSLVNANILEESQTTLSNRLATKLVYSGQAEGYNFSFKNMQIVTLKGDRVYKVTYTAKIDDYEHFLKTAESMIKSLKID
ncbi:TPR repeat-containing serine/threonine protein kinase [Sphaerospermopsis reniformis]|uniref:non-specific serine/threonine protein kinase n=1 Tax=Sphaerospermopsis reniformis TaxID=531300 RepID=A0A479ZUM7_9CYAN|nr:TPR repeat-containing serine/threonine protein kinase [Sphaerospermopsis reniformis]